MITIIAAIGENYELGKDNKLLWNLPSDLKRFKKLTSGHHIIMGRKTYESIGRPLPNRVNVIITRDKEYTAKGCIVVHSMIEAIDIAKGEDVFIIGGSEIYKQAIDFADILEITLVHNKFDADVFFPKVDINSWQEISALPCEKDEKNEYDCTYIRYSR